MVLGRVSNTAQEGRTLKLEFFQMHSCPDGAPWPPFIKKLKAAHSTEASVEELTKYYKCTVIYFDWSISVDFETMEGSSRVYLICLACI